jgi:hypothetical protein
MGSPIKACEADPFEYNAIKLSFKPVDDFEVFVDDFGLTNVVNENTSATHFQSRCLKGLGKFIGFLRIEIELGKHCIETVSGYEAV